MKYRDSWTAPLIREGKKKISGGAARNVRISKSGGMDSIITDTLNYALNKANAKSDDLTVPTPQTTSVLTENQTPAIH
ncbi:hypothetical protein [Pseudoalteromonas denitrificans]|uniref:Uncharacterized protein n=1 Tax=Pseudoalteromonas denitrificans DSM 6059 TaxID=1123010 RepID=A0A1I1GD42_9GAMM|nr:hypothetical protein [Pseudoalteromonas denitrificans]SFC09386.1 hypothetical protein SAMN02745724_00907 [Pseudoalteromonas denitrificans DSM 6059]